MASLLDRIRGWLNRPALERAEHEQGMTRAERQNDQLDYESKKDDDNLLHRSAAEAALHFDDDSKPPG